MMEEYRVWRSDLASELRGAARTARREEESAGGTCRTKEESDGVRVERLTLDAREGAAIGRAPGHYVTISFGAPWLFGEDEKRRCTDAVARELRGLLDALLPSAARRRILCAGLGNRRLTSDAIGPAVLSKVTVTGHLPDGPLLDALTGGVRVFALTPGVCGDTGIESARQTKSVCACCTPDVMIVVDALAAGAVDRLCTTVQLCDTGIAPGSGVGNDRPAFDAAYFGVPVVALGVPTVVDAPSFFHSYLRSAGLDPEALPPSLLAALKKDRSFFVSPKEIDAAVETLGDILAEAIDRAVAEGGAP